jgi:predicted nucleic acid-binding protein
MRKIVIVNTSLLFYLHKSGYLHILEKLYSEIIIPHAVLLELEEGRKAGEDVPEIKDHGWINRGLRVRMGINRLRCWRFKTETGRDGWTLFG